MIEVIIRRLSGERELMEEVEELESGAGFHHQLRRGVHPTAEKLDMWRDCVSAVTIKDRDFMYSIRVEDEEG